MTPRRTSRFVVMAALVVVLPATGCRQKEPEASVRASGYVEATEVQVSAQVGGRLLAVRVNEGDRVAVGQLIGEIDPIDINLALRRAQAERAQADAQLRLLLAGARKEDIRQAQAQEGTARADLAGAERDLEAAETDLKRFEALLRTNSGSEKQRDDAASRRDMARARVDGAREKMRGATEGVARLKAGARPEEIEAARARVAAADAQIATFQQNLADASIESPVAGVVTQKLADTGETLAPRVPVVAVADLDHAWANVYVDEPVVPRLRLGQKAAVRTDAGGQPIPGTITFISPQAEFTPRNVQTAEERSRLVYRVKITVDNRSGVLKQGMPVEADLVVGSGSGR